MKLGRLTIVVVLALVVASCSGGSDGGVASLDAESTSRAPNTSEPAGDAESESGVDEEAALLAFSQCMRDEGIDIPDPTVDADGNIGLGFEAGAAEADFDAIEDAFSACSSHLEGVTLGFTEADVSEFEDRMLEFAQCMRDNGYDMDDPDFSDFALPGGAADDDDGGGFIDIDPTDPDFEPALEACQDILAGFGPGGFGGGDET